MRCGSAILAVAVASLPTIVAAAEDLVPVQQQRYCMGTIFEIVAYHPDRTDAERALSGALDEIARLDAILSHFKADSDLSRLNREARHGFVAVDVRLFEVIEKALEFSARSGGAFDITIAPLLRAWQAAYEQGRVPSEKELTEARRCVGYDKIEMQAPHRIRFDSPCMELDLGGIGKGYAVDRALEVLQSKGIGHAVVNSGGSTIAAIGHPPGLRGWPVALAGRVEGSATLLLRNQSISTSQQKGSVLAVHPESAGEIIDPRTAAPASDNATVSVVAPGATAADALSTTLLLLAPESGRHLLEQYPDVSAFWISPAGELETAYRASRLTMDASHSNR